MEAQEHLNEKQTIRSVSWKSSQVMAFIIIIILLLCFFLLLVILPFNPLVSFFLSLLIILLPFCMWHILTRSAAQRAIITRSDLIVLRKQLLEVTPSAQAMIEAQFIDEGLMKAINNMAPVCRGYGFFWPAPRYFSRIREGLKVLELSDTENQRLFMESLDLIEKEYAKRVLAPPAEVLGFAEVLRDSLLDYRAKLAPPPPP